jgi:hypothetical protein
MTPYQEKFGNMPDHCKVPMFNLKTRKIKILDFEDLGEQEVQTKPLVFGEESKAGNVEEEPKLLINKSLEEQKNGD